MNSRIPIQKELNEISSLLPHDIKQPVFTVPEGYFENFAATVWHKINSQNTMNADEELETLSPVLAAIPRKMPFAVPENYFSNLTQHIPALTGDEQLPSFLMESNRQMPYDVPTVYFEGVADSVMARIKRPAGKVVSFAPRRWMQIASAAVIAGLIVIGGVFYFKSSSSSSVDPNQQPDQWVASKLKNISNRELEEFISTADVSLSGKEFVQASNSNVEVEKMLKDVSNKELEAFLEQVPSDHDDKLIYN